MQYDSINVFKVDIFYSENVQIFDANTVSFFIYIFIQAHANKQRHVIP